MWKKKQWLTIPMVCFDYCCNYLIGHWRSPSIFLANRLVEENIFFLRQGEDDWNFFRFETTPSGEYSGKLRVWKQRARTVSSCSSWLVIVGFAVVVVDENFCTAKFWKSDQIGDHEAITCCRRDVSGRNRVVQRSMNALEFRFVLIELKLSVIYCFFMIFLFSDVI